ncbi:unnamed protein product [Gongylonema pulchrum]|uniref:Alpha-1,3-galactosyltransferase 2 n=1 Tax=Gongylonema pulchrum TaxID=637853 RepID=A0A183DNL4_9BILA|nr:unnamed protein product [Gongylonema pulchrum]
MMTLFPSAPCLIVIEEDVILLRGFLYFLGQLLPHFLKDRTANVIHTYNENAAEYGEFSLMYRVENHTAVGAYLLKKSFYEEYIKDRKVKFIHMCLKTAALIEWNFSYMYPWKCPNPVSERFH